MKHVRVIVTEVGAEVNVTRLVVGSSKERVELRTREALRQVIESEVPEDHRPEDLEAVLDHGYWSTDQPPEEYSVLVLRSERVEFADRSVVEVQVDGGIVTSVQAPQPVQVRVVDYDLHHIDGARVVTDGKGRPCIITTWGEAVTDE